MRLSVSGELLVYSICSVPFTLLVVTLRFASILYLIACCQRSGWLKPLLIVEKANKTIVSFSWRAIILRFEI